MRPSLLPGLVTAAQRNRDRGFADGALFELGHAYRGARAGGSVRRGGRRPLRPFGACRAPAAIGRARYAGRRCVRRQGRRGGGACRPRPRPGQPHRHAARRPPGSIPAAPARSSSGRRWCSACSASCIRRCWPSSAPTRRSPCFELYLDAIPAAKRKSRDQAGARCFRPASREAATSPSCSTPTSRRGTWCARR